MKATTQRGTFVSQQQPESLSAVVAAGDMRDSLIAVRDLLARSLEQCDSMRDLAALSRQLTSVMTQLDALPDATEVSRADDLKAKRDARRSGTSSKARTARSK